MRFTDGENEFELVDQSKLMWTESDALEKVTGMTMAEITAKGQVCGCGHRIEAHRQEDSDDPKCQECGCDTPIENLPVRVSQALVWISMKRVHPELSFKDVGSMPSFLQQVEEDEDLPQVEPDPTGADEAPSLSDA